MRNRIHKKSFVLAALPLALAAAMPRAHAEDADITDLVSRPNEVSVGVIGATGDSNDRALYGQYNGLRKNDGNLLLDLYFSKREASGVRWFVEGVNLGLESREVRAGIERQGDWKVFGEYWQNVRREPRTVNTYVQGAGGNTPLVTRGATVGGGEDLELKQERKRTTLAGQKWLGENTILEASFINEDKSGARL